LIIGGQKMGFAPS